MSLRETLGLESLGTLLFTCKACGCHTAGPPSVRCWACGGIVTRKMLPPVLKIGERVWRALATMTGWTCLCACGRVLHQWADSEPRPSHVQCPGCRTWVEAP